MENYIFYCYKEWLEDKDGNLSKQIFKLPCIARVLFAVLLVGLIAFFVILGFTIGGCDCTIPLLIWCILYFLTCVTITIYTEKYQVKTSKRSLKEYDIYTKEMLHTVFTDNNISEKLIPILIERFNTIVKKTDEIINLKHEKMNKFMEVLLIPVSVLILGAMLEKGTDATQTLGFGLSGILIILLIYAIIFIVLFAYDIILRFPLVKYKQFITDMQSLLDFSEYIISNESSDSIRLSSSTRIEPENTNVNS